ncbi:MAG TPA: hypothetical protein VKB46_25820 [Pyrinomonadaceae bacterium]|nr:hypothetical protein [Pyrinomonadaceae bacterium]
MRSVLLVPILAALTGCHTASSNSSPSFSAGDLIREYEQSVSTARHKYDGKEVSVRGLVQSAASLPVNGADQGSVWLEESDESGVKIGCWFSKDQAPEFSRIKSGQHLTIKGIFNGEAGVELKFCHVVKVE